MRIEHVALWTEHLEALRVFYEQYFNAETGEKYTNPHKQFESYFLCFASGARLELMSTPGVADRPAGATVWTGYAHLAFSVGSEAAVDELTEQLRRGGHAVVDGPRRTGDGYYEASVLDSDGNRIEITV